MVLDQALMRLTQARTFEWIGRSLYTAPRTSRFGLKAMLPRLGRGRLEVHGAKAARRLGFRTQVPAQPMFHTTGSSRRLRLGQLQGRLPPVAPRKLALAAHAQADLRQGLAPVMGRRAELLEKDIWRCQVLDLLFQLPCRKPMAFKGGTSLPRV